MKPVSMKRPGITFHNNDRSQSTAFYIFNHRDGRTPTHLFEVSNAHFIRKAGTKRSLIVTDGSTDDANRIADLMTPVYGSIEDMVDYYHDGARISFPDYQTAVEVYKRIQDHFDHHLKQARGSKHYTAPPIEDMVKLSDFAMGIRNIALMADPDLDQTKRAALQSAFFGSRPSFSRDDVLAPVKKPEAELNTPATKRDAIERYLDSIN